MAMAIKAPTLSLSVDGKSRRRRIVCISDTHGQHSKLLPCIPDGDILIHAGDFTNKLRKRDMVKSLEEFNDFLQKLPHKHKIVIAGNHEIALNGIPREEIQKHLSNCHYLQDSSVMVDGLKIYGSPWTNSVEMGFSCSGKYLHKYWDRIPLDTDVLVTHLPPEGVLDLPGPRPGHNGDGEDEEEGRRRGRRRRRRRRCAACGARHGGGGPRAHWGSAALARRVARAVRPRAHVFGHVHEGHGFLEKGGVLYINAANEQVKRPIYFDMDVLLPEPEYTPVALKGTKGKGLTEAFKTTGTVLHSDRKRKSKRYTLFSDHINLNGDQDNSHIDQSRCDSKRQKRETQSKSDAPNAESRNKHSSTKHGEGSRQTHSSFMLARATNGMPEQEDQRSTGRQVVLPLPTQSRRQQKSEDRLWWQQQHDHRQQQHEEGGNILTSRKNGRGDLMSWMFRKTYPSHGYGYSSSAAASTHCFHYYKQESINNNKRQRIHQQYYHHANVVADHHHHQAAMIHLLGNNCRFSEKLLVPTFPFARSGSNNPQLLLRNYS